MLCTKIAFGNWALSALNPDGGCGPYSGTIASAHDPRRAFVISGALWQYFTWFQQAGMSSIVPARHIIGAEATLSQTTSGEVDYLQALVDYLMSLQATANRRYVHLARAAFAEKGVFLKALHESRNGSNYEDAPLRPRCDVGSSCSVLDALATLSGALTAAGPINWKQATADAPEFRGFVVPGTWYENKGPDTAVGHLDLSTSPSFPAGATTISQEVDVDTSSAVDPTTNTNSQINCSPPGFFHATVPAATHGALAGAAIAAAAASGAEPRIYYRLRECSASGGGCVNTTSVVPAYTVIIPTGSTGCTVTCAIGAAEPGRTGRIPALLAALAGLLLSGSRREAGRRRRRREKQQCAAS